MNKNILNPGRRLNSLFAGIMLMLLLAASSCQKREIDITSSLNDLANSPDEITNIARILEGEVISGSLSNESDDEGLAIIYRDEKEIVFLQQIPSETITATGNIQHAELIYSKFGVVIRDTDTKKTWLYPNNDTESRQRFESVRSYLPENFSLSEITGTIRIKISEDKMSVAII